MKNQCRRIYKHALIFSFGVHIFIFLLIILFEIIFPYTMDDIIEVTLSTGDINSVVEDSVNKFSKQEEKKIEQSEIIKRTEIKNENLFVDKNIEQNEQEEKKYSKPFMDVGDNNLSKYGDGGQDELTSMPKIIKMVKPVYPFAARNQERQGKVYVRLLISSRGVVDNAEIIQTSGYIPLDEAVLNAVYKWRFLPAKNKYGKQCACHVIVPVKFELKDIK